MIQIYRTPQRSIAPLIRFVATSTLIVIMALPFTLTAEAAVTVETNIAYRPSLADDTYATERCKFDLYMPQSEVATPVLIWFHGGGLEGGSKESKHTKALAQSLAEQGISVIVPNYRLSPRVQFPTYLEDAAAVVRFALQNSVTLEDRPGVFIGGHSAGGYIASMLAMNPQYLRDAGVDQAQIAGYIPMSGQTMTHFTVAKERGKSLPGLIADDAAPISYLRKDTRPMLMLMGSHDWPARLEENRYFVAAMRQVAKNDNIAMVEVANRNHGTIMHGLANPNDPATIATVSFIQTGQLPADQLLNRTL